MNGCGHTHRCLACGAPYECDMPECRLLAGFGACPRCGGTYRITETNAMVGRGAGHWGPRQPAPARGQGLAP